MAVKWLKQATPALVNPPYKAPDNDLSGLEPLPVEVKDMALADVLNEMQVGADYLTSKHKALFNGLKDSVLAYKNPSPKQTYWIRKLYARALGLEGLPSAAASVSVGNLAGLYGMFQKAKKALKWPKLVLDAPGVGTVVLGLAGPAAKFPGTINVLDDGSYPDNLFFGRVTKEGEFQPNPKAGDKIGPITALLKDLSDNPGQAASKHAKLTGKCMFCRKPLSDPKSTAVGYGYVCSQNWGLETEWKKAEGLLVGLGTTSPGKSSDN